MANIRIKDLPSTATLEADDRILVDSLTEGTRSIDKDDFLSELEAIVPGYAATSTSSQTIGNSGTKTFTTQAGLAYQAGTRVRAADASNPSTNWMEGVVSSYSSTTLVFTADKSAGSGTLTNWTLNVAGQPGADGAGSLTGSVGATDNRLVRSDGTDGSTVQGSAVTVDDSGNMSGVAALSATTIELGHASDTTISRTGAGAIAVEGVGVALNSTSLPHTASTIELGHASDTTLSRSSAGVVACEGNILQQAGKQTIWVPASAMIVPTSFGSSALAKLATGDVTYPVLDFDASSFECAIIPLALPKSWNAGTITFRALWTHGSTTTNFSVVWAMNGVSLGDNVSLTATYSNGSTVTDTGGTANNLYISGESTTLTLDYTAANSELVALRIFRDATSGSDTMAVDARLLGIWIHYTTNAANDA